MDGNPQGVQCGSVNAAGAALDLSLGSTSPASIGVAMVTLGFIPLVAFAVTRRFARFITPRA